MVSSIIENLVCCIVNPRVDLLYSGDFGIHQWFLSRFENPIVVFKIHEWIYSSQVILPSISGFEYNRKPCGCIGDPRLALVYSDHFGIHHWFLSRTGNPVVLLEIHVWICSTQVTLASPMVIYGQAK